MQHRRHHSLVFGLVGVAFVVGCAEGESTTANSTETNQPAEVAADGFTDTANTDMKSAGAEKTGAEKTGAAETFELKPLTLSNLARPSEAEGGNSKTTAAGDSEKQIQSIIGHLQPLQILLGQWRGTTRREFENFKAVDSHEWVWDLRNDPGKPALTIESDKSPYLKTGRLSWDVERQLFTLTATDTSGTTRSYSGDFSEPVHEIVGSDDKLHRVFRLEFTQDADASAGNAEQWQLALAQQENNRYLLEIAKRRGSAAFARYDTVSTQREGTSFALSDTDYAEKTCIISEGLGTTEVVYKGRSYWVCCSGCKAAFDEDLETWIARAAARDKK